MFDLHLTHMMLYLIIKSEEFRNHLPPSAYRFVLRTSQDKFKAYGWLNFFKREIDDEKIF